MKYKKEFIEFMIKSGVLTFGDFVTKSGRRTPYFVNTGNYKTGCQIAQLGRFYAECIMENIAAGRLSGEITALFGPAYKGIPIAVSTCIALSENFQKEVNFCFNRKEEKDHGEGGVIVGYKFGDSDKILLVEDVITAGTAVRETLPIIKRQADAEVCGLVISVDRMERGKGEMTAIDEIREEFGIETYPIVTVREIMNEADLDGEIRVKMEEYLKTYCR